MKRSAAVVGRRPDELKQVGPNKAACWAGHLGGDVAPLLAAVEHHVVDPEGLGAGGSGSGVKLAEERSSSRHSHTQRGTAAVPHVSVACSGQTCIMHAAPCPHLSVCQS